MVSGEIRKLENKWVADNGWPKFLDWLELKGVRGWNGQRINFSFPIVAIVGENGSGKSTIIQAAACAYQNDKRVWFPSEFFPETAWDNLQDVRLDYGYKQGKDRFSGSFRKPSTRWLGGPERPKRPVEYIDLSRLQPVGTRVGYSRIAKNKHQEASAKAFDTDQVSRLSQIMGRNYDNARMALTDIDAVREIPVLTKEGKPYSGYHQGSGETTIAELLRAELPKNGLVLIDEIESSLHPRAQRRLIRDLAEAARVLECQIILTTHSPYVLEELPLQARIYILESGPQKQTVSGVSPLFAMTKMDDEPHPDCELYVEDERAKVWLSEMLSRDLPDAYVRCSIVPYGAANLGVALGQMVKSNRFTRPTLVFLDGDQAPAEGCLVLPGNDAPERVVFQKLKQDGWRNLWTRVGRDISDVADACSKAMLIQDHHEWLRSAANTLRLGSDVLWHAMCCEWVEGTQRKDRKSIVDEIETLLQAAQNP
ncbi:ATP-dependent nuclease [Shinella zoogloeoides]